MRNTLWYSVEIKRKIPSTYRHIGWEFINTKRNYDAAVMLAEKHLLPDREVRIRKVVKTISWLNGKRVLNAKANKSHSSAEAP